MISRTIFAGVVTQYSLRHMYIPQFLTADNFEKLSNVFRLCNYKTNSSYYAIYTGIYTDHFKSAPHILYELIADLFTSMLKRSPNFFSIPIIISMPKNRRKSLPTKE